MPGDPTEQHRVGDPVAHGVEERAPVARGPTVAGHGAVEQVGKPGEYHAEDGKEEVSAGDEQRGAHSGCQPQDGQGVGRETRSVERATYRLEAPFGFRAPASVEHSQGSFLG